MERGGLTYEINSETPFTGVSLTKYDNGQIKLKIEFKDGEINGISTEFLKNGQKQKESNYRVFRFNS